MLQDSVRRYEFSESMGSMRYQVHMLLDYGVACDVVKWAAVDWPACCMLP